MSEPQADDVIIYRDRRGQVVHSGLVRAGAARGPVLVESKWGEGARYVHTPEGQPFSPWFAFYRSARPGHLLTGIDSSAPAAERRSKSRATRTP